MEYVRIGYDFRRNLYSIFIEKDELVAMPLEFKERESRYCELDPVVSVPKEVAQGVMNDLWREGLRPDGYKDEIKVADAMKDHLSDLRTLCVKPKERY